MTVNRQARHFILGKVITQRHRLKGPSTLVETLPEILDIRLADIDDLLYIREQRLHVLYALGKNGQTEYRPVLGKRDAIAVIDQPASWRHRLNLHTVAI